MPSECGHYSPVKEGLLTIDLWDAILACLLLVYRGCIAEKSLLSCDQPYSYFQFLRRFTMTFDVFMFWFLFILNILLIFCGVSILYLTYLINKGKKQIWEWDWNTKELKYSILFIVFGSMGSIFSYLLL